MSSFMIWHKITVSKHTGSSGGALAAVASAFGFGLPLTLTNNVYSLGLVVDVDATLTMSEGGTADRFTVTVYNLPAKDAVLLTSAHGDGGLDITIALGYFDHPTQVFGNHPVMRGRVEEVKRSVAEDGRPTVELIGLEQTGHALLHRRAAVTVPGSGALDDVVKQLLAGVPDASLTAGSSLGGPVKDFTLRDGSVLSALAQLAEKADKPLLVGDGAVALGPAVGSATAPIDFVAGVNIAKLGDSQKQKRPEADAPSTPSSSAPSPVPTASPGPAAAVVAGLELTVLGHPGLRVGQMVKVTGLDEVPAKPLRITKLTHKYSTKSGYVCEASLADLGPGVRATSATGAAAVVDEWNKVIQAARVANPVVDVGQVTAYTAGSASPGHRVTMHYAQAPAKGVQAPSMDAEVLAGDSLSAKPVAAPFAFDKVGLITPVYPGMRALLVHNRSLTNDAIVAGWLWPSTPASTPPPNEPGDYWLALPTGLSGEGRPTGKGVNDLTDARGARVIQARGLHILVGASKLPEVGTRPTVPEDDTIVIEHSSGTTITIDAQGALSITTKNQPIVVGNGSVSLKVDGSKVAVS